jgi:xanthine dehydrogenase accessory factor
LFLCGIPVVILEREEPLAVRRLVSFADAVSNGEAEVEGVIARLVASTDEALASLWTPELIPLLVDPDATAVTALEPAVVVDARMRKLRCAERRFPGARTLGLGPGFVAGKDVDAVIETHRGTDMGRVIATGSAREDTAVPTPVEGIDFDRVVRAPRAGIFTGSVEIGALVEAGDSVGSVAGEPVQAPIAGLVRGLLRSGVSIPDGVKIGDIDPRGRGVDPRRLSDKGRAVASGVLEAVLSGLEERGVS